MAISTRRKIISALGQDKRSPWTAIPIAGSGIKLTRRMGRKVISVVLVKNKHKFMLTPVRYPFTCRNSHFDYMSVEREERRCRNKGIFKSLFKSLREAGCLNLISNKDSFIDINRENTKSVKENLKKELSSFK